MMGVALSDEENRKTNEEKKALGLRAKIERQHAYRTQIWAQCELRIREAQAALDILGQPGPDLFEPQFDDDESLRHYAAMSLS